jgi:hypothetical protein
MDLENTRTVACLAIQNCLFTIFISHPNDLMIRDGIVITRISVPLQRKKLNTDESLFYRIRQALQKMNITKYSVIEIGVEKSNVITKAEMMLAAMPFKLMNNISSFDFLSILARNAQAKNLEIIEDPLEKEKEKSIKAIKEFSELIKKEIARRQ